MKYCRFMTEQGPRYGNVEERDGELYVVQTWTSLMELSTVPGGADPVKLESLTVLPAVTPSKIVCIGRNYSEHAAELGNDVPKEPLLFLKPPSALLAHGGEIWKPGITQRLDFEGELGVVIGKRASRVGPDQDVRQYIAGYTLVNDVTMRDIQKSDGQWTRGKGFDTSCPVGPIVSDEIDPVTTPVTLKTWLNGELRQTGSTSQLIFPIDELIRYISAVMTLEPGDLIPTGTPSGVGPMNAGDVVEVSVEGLGVLRNRVG